MKNILYLGLIRGKLEIKMYLRKYELICFSLIYPLLLLVMLSIVISLNNSSHSINSSHIILASLIGSCIVTAGYSNVATQIVTERKLKVLKRTSILPMSPYSYFIGKIIYALFASAFQILIILLIGIIFLKISIPLNISKIFVFLTIYILGISSTTLMGISVSNLIKNVEGNEALIVIPVLFMQFISGVFIPIQILTKHMSLIYISSIYPLRWVAQGMRYVFLEDKYKVVELHHEWNLLTVYKWLIILLIVHALIAKLSFKWNNLVYGD